jgi:hypothetical protein
VLASATVQALAEEVVQAKTETTLVFALEIVWGN